MEVNVKQGTAAWLAVRKTVPLTASKIGDAIGVGQGKPIDFLHHMLDIDAPPFKGNNFTRHGNEMETHIRNAYGTITKIPPKESGFWPKYDVGIGASPDALIVSHDGRLTGVVEFKAPVYRLYSQIPSSYIAQMHCQMACTGTKWCDFMAVCHREKRYMLKRVHFHEPYWRDVMERIQIFVAALKGDEEARAEVAAWPVKKPFSNETNVPVNDMMKAETALPYDDLFSESVCSCTDF